MLSSDRPDIALAHLSLNFFGGEEKLCLSIIEALKMSKHKVTLFTIDRTDWTGAMRFFGSFMRPDVEIFSEFSTMHHGLTKASIAASAYIKYLLGLVKLRRKYDMVINTYGDMVNSIADVAYVHFPIKATIDYSQTPAFLSPTRWALYCQIYKLATSVLDSINPSFLLTNSKFTQQIIRKYMKREALVLHPPVDVQSYASRNEKSESFVVTVSKFTPKRCLHRVPLIARKTQKAKFIIAGGADEYSTKTIADLKKVIEECNLEDRVILMPNVQRSKLVELLARSKVYLHVMPSEHFGISIIEAMAAGCVPIVHRSGGPWLDILNQNQGKYGFSYTTLEEAAYLIDNIMDNEKLRSEVSGAAQERSLEYDETIFRKNLQTIIGKLASSNR